MDAFWSLIPRIQQNHLNYTKRNDVAKDKRLMNGKCAGRIDDEIHDNLHKIRQMMTFLCLVHTLVNWTVKITHKPNMKKIKIQENSKIKWEAASTNS